MNRNIRIINPQSLVKAIHKMDCGESPFAEIGAEHFEIPAWEMKPIDGYEVPENKTTKEKLPNCCPSHKSIFKNVTTWYEKFPNCCDHHRKLLKANWFKKESYKGVADKVINQLSFTEYHVATQINLPDWYKDITDYIEANISSFGQLPAGYGSPVGLNFYMDHLKAIVSKTKMPKNKQRKLIEYVEGYDSPKEGKKPNLNLLYDIYKKWLKAFPFEISYFKDLKVYFEKQIPFLDGKPEMNKYSGLSKTKVQTQSGLLLVLLKTTQDLLTQINGLVLYEKGLITNANKIQIELINENRRIELNELMEQSCDDKQKYVKLIKEWLKGEKDYFNEIAPLLDQGQKDTPKSQVASIGNKFYTDQDFQELVRELLNLDLFRINDFLEYHFSNSFGNSAMNNVNWLTGLRKHLLWLKKEITILNNEDYNTKIGMAELWDRNKTGDIVTEVNERMNKTNQSPQQRTFEEIEKLENQFWKGIPMNVAINHFKPLTERKSKNGNVFLTKEQLNCFVQRAFLKDKEQPKQKINFSNGEKGFVIKRFYEFFDLAVSHYAEVNKKDKYISLVLNNFDNLGTVETVKSFFKSGKTKEKWD